MTATVILYNRFSLYNCLEKTTQTVWKTWKTQGISFCQICKHPVIVAITVAVLSPESRMHKSSTFQRTKLKIFSGAPDPTPTGEGDTLERGIRPPQTPLLSVLPFECLRHLTGPPTIFNKLPMLTRTPAPRLRLLSPLGFELASPPQY